MKFTSTLRMDMEGVPSIKNILLDARNNNVLVLNTETAIQAINREEKDEKTPSKQKKKLEEHEDKFSLKVIKKYNVCIKYFIISIRMKLHIVLFYSI